MITEICKKSRFRKPFDKQHVRRAQTLSQSWRQHLYHIFWSLWRYLSLKRSLLVLCKNLRLFVNSMTANDKYCLFNRENLTQPIEIVLSQKQKTFSQIFSVFLKSTLNFEYFKKKMTLITDVFPELRTPKKGH